MLDLLTTVLVVVEVHMVAADLVVVMVMGLVEMEDLLMDYQYGQVAVAVVLVALLQVLMVVPDFSYQPHIMTHLP
jgi:hypothetical protein